jgi:hypothetical protein
VSALLAALLLGASTFVAAAAPAAAPVSEPSAPNACTELLSNGNFEAGPANWTQEGGGSAELITDFNPRGSSQYSADLAGINNANHSVKQQFTVPADVVVTVSFWWEQWTQENAPTTKDYLTVNVLNASGALLAELVRLGADPAQPPWERRTVSLSIYAGTTVQLQFKGVNDALLPTEFFVDDVSVSACDARRLYLPLIHR